MSECRVKHVNYLQPGHIVIIHNEGLDRDTCGVVLNYWQNGKVLVAVPKLGGTTICTVDELELVGSMTLYSSAEDAGT